MFVFLMFFFNKKNCDAKMIIPTLKMNRSQYLSIYSQFNLWTTLSYRFTKYDGISCLSETFCTFLKISRNTRLKRHQTQMKQTLYTVSKHSLLHIAHWGVYTAHSSMCSACKCELQMLCFCPTLRDHFCGVHYA